MAVIWEDTPTKFDKNLVIDINELYESYEKKDIEDISQKISAIKLQDFAEDLQNIRNFKKIRLIGSIHDITVESLAQKYYEIREAINSTLTIKSKFIDYKRNWKEIENILVNVFNIKKNELMITDEIKELKNQDLRNSEISYRLRTIVDSQKKIDIVMLRIKYFEDELQETLAYLQDVKTDISRLQSAVGLALDTGEIPRTYWRKSNENQI